MKRQGQTILTITVVVLTFLAALFMWENTRETKKSSDKIMDEFKRADESLKRSNDSLIQKGIGAFHKDSAE